MQSLFWDPLGRKNPGQVRTMLFITLGVGRLLPYGRGLDVFSESPMPGIC